MTGHEGQASGRAVVNRAETDEEVASTPRTSSNFAGRSLSSMCRGDFSIVPSRNPDYITFRSSSMGSSSENDPLSFTKSRRRTAMDDKPSKAVARNQVRVLKMVPTPPGVRRRGTNMARLGAKPRRRWLMISNARRRGPGRRRPDRPLPLALTLLPPTNLLTIATNAGTARRLGSAAVPCVSPSATARLPPPFFSATRRGAWVYSP